MTAGTDSLAEELVAFALRIAAQGWALFPVTPGGKRPALAAWQNVAHSDPVRIRRCWARGPFNIGIHAGRSGLVILDCDIAKPNAVPPEPYAGTAISTGRQVLADLEGEAGEDLPATFTVTTPTGGAHLYFLAPDTGQLPDGAQLSNTAGRLGWLIDTRAGNGYVLGPGSRVGDRAYTITDASPPAPLPRWLLNKLAAVPGDHRVPSPLPTQKQRRADYVAAIVRAELSKVYKATPGTRNHTLFTAAATLGELVAAGELDRGTIHAALVAAAEAAGLGSDQTQPDEIARTIASGLRVGAHHPRAEATAEAA